MPCPLRAGGVHRSVEVAMLFEGCNNMRHKVPEVSAFGSSDDARGGRTIGLANGYSGHFKQGDARADGANGFGVIEAFPDELQGNVERGKRCYARLATGDDDGVIND